MLRFIKGIFIITAFLAVILPAMGFFLSSKISLMVNQWIAAISPYARVSYGAMDIDLNGQVTLFNTSVDFQNDDAPPVHIQQIQLSFPDLFNTYKMALNGESYQAPDILNIDLQGIRLFFLDSNQLSHHFATRNALLNSHHSVACGSSYLMGPQQLQDMGYSQSNLMNISVHFQYFNLNQTLDVVFNTEVQALGFTTIGLTLDRVSSLTPGALFGNKTVRMERLSFDYLDDGYIDRKLSYCSRMSGLSRDRYIASMGTQNADFYNAIWGMIPGSTVRTAYESFLRNPQRMSFNMEFQHPLPVDIP